MNGASALQESLPRALEPALSGVRISSLRRLTAGANMETWSFTATDRDGSAHELILRRLPEEAASAAPEDQVPRMPLADEARLLEAAWQCGVCVPRVIAVLAPTLGLGEGFVMSRESGEALPQRLFSDDCYTDALAALARECGIALARIHAIPRQRLPGTVPGDTLEARLAAWQALLVDCGDPSPALQVGLIWLSEHLPVTDTTVLLHGDFRMGNLLVNREGLSSVLDWERAHLGHPLEDLGYLCSPVWRFGRRHLEVGGFGTVEALLDGYASEAGWRPEKSALRYWQVLAAMDWGMVCLTMGRLFAASGGRALERAAVSRRLTEAELEVLLLLDETGDRAA